MSEASYTFHGSLVTGVTASLVGRSYSLHASQEAPSSSCVRLFHFQPHEGPQRRVSKAAPSKGGGGQAAARGEGDKAGPPKKRRAHHFAELNLTSVNVVQLNFKFNYICFFPGRTIQKEAEEGSIARKERGE